MSNYGGLYRSIGSDEEDDDHHISEDSDSEGEGNVSYYSSSGISDPRMPQVRKIGVTRSKLVFRKKKSVDGKESSVLLQKQTSKLHPRTQAFFDKQASGISTSKILKPKINTSNQQNIVYSPDSEEGDTSSNISYDVTSSMDSNATDSSSALSFPKTTSEINIIYEVDTELNEEEMDDDELDDSDDDDSDEYSEDETNIVYGVDNQEEQNIVYGVGTTTQNISYGVDHSPPKSAFTLRINKNDNNNNNNNNNREDSKKIILGGIKFRKSNSDSSAQNVNNINYGTEETEQNISYGVETADNKTQQSQIKSIDAKTQASTRGERSKESITFGSRTKALHKSANPSLENNSSKIESENFGDTLRRISYGTGTTSQNISYGVDESSLDNQNSVLQNQNISYGVDTTDTFKESIQNISYGSDITETTHKNDNNNNNNNNNNKSEIPKIGRKIIRKTRNLAPKKEPPKINNITIPMREEPDQIGGRSRTTAVVSEPTEPLLSPRDMAKQEEEKDKLGMKECHWNTEFQNALDMPEGKEKWEKLAHLARDFVYCSKTYGKIIISEYYLPEEEKTIKSCDAGGVAGGSKYICSNIFFKFALDTDLLAGTRAARGLDENQLPPLWMYGGSDGRNDYAAMKSSKNDMIGLMSYYNTKTPGLCFPLMSVIDYRGFRLIAMSILPITKESIKYGSADGGKVVHKDIKELNKKMKEVAEKLNLKGHNTGQKKVTVYGPGDIEGHLGKDGKFYVLDFGRVFPPEAPDPPGSRKIFYCLLRPEFVRAYPIPLSSDAFSCWGKVGSAVHNKEVMEATQYLYDKVIPNFALELSQKDSESEIRLTEILHANGINCRHYGRVRRAVPLQASRIQRLLLNEMLGRTLTSVLRQLLRYQMQKTRIASQEPYKIVVLDFFNALLMPPKARYSKTNQSPKSPGFYATPALKDVDSTAYLLLNKFWTRDIKVWLNDKFEYGLNDNEMKQDYDLRADLDMEKLIIRVCGQSGIKLSKAALTEFRNSRENFKLLNFDLKKMSAKVRHLNVIDEAEGNLLYIEASSAQGRSGLWEATNRMYARAVSSNTNNPQTYVRWGSILMDQSSRVNITPENLAEYEQILASAREKFAVALKIDNMMPFAYFELAITLLEQAVTMQLFKSSDTIAISLWMITKAQESLRKAFFIENAPRSLLFPSLIERAEEIYQQAKLAVEKKNASRANILFLKSFYMIHCAVTTAPFVPEATVFLTGAQILKDFLVFSQRGPKFLTGLAGSYLESAFLTYPSCSDGEVIYYQTKSNYQRSITGTNDHLPSYFDNNRDLQSKNDVVLIYERKATNSDSMCPYISNEEISVPKDTPLHMLPVITRDPTDDYHGTIGINRILHVLCNDIAVTNLDICAYNVYNNNNNHRGRPIEEDNSTYIFYKTSWLFLLNHSGYHHFLLTHINIRYPKYFKQTDTDATPKQIKLYGSNNEDIIHLSMEEIQMKINDSSDNTFFIFCADLDTNEGMFEARLRQPNPAKYLIMEFVPPSNSIKNLHVSSISLRGHQCYTTERKDVALSSEDLRKLKPKLRTSRDSMYGLYKKPRESDSFDLTDLSRSNRFSLMVDLKSVGICWNNRKHSPRLIIGEDYRTVKLIHKRFVLKHERGIFFTDDGAHTCQADRPLHWNETSISHKLSFSRDSIKSDTTPVTDLCPMVLWVDENHTSNVNKTLYSTAKVKCSNIIIVKVNSLSHAKKWITTQIDYQAKSAKLVQKLITKNIFRIVVSHSLPFEEEVCTAEHFIEWLKATLTPEDWNLVPVLVIGNNVDDVNLYKNKHQNDEKIFATSSTETISEFLSFNPEFFNKHKPPTWNKSIPSKNPFNALSRSIQGDSCEIKPLDAEFLYFEIRVIGIERGGVISIGLTNRNFPIHGAMPGTLPDSLAYNSDHGYIYCGNSHKPYLFHSGMCHPYGDGDVIGCGFNTRTQQVFWTKNGKYLGTAEQSRSKFAYLAGLRLFPTVGITKGGIFTANFGTEPFLFLYSTLSEEQLDQSKPKQISSDQKISEISPYKENLFELCLKNHGDNLLVVSTLARYSRSFNVLLRAHFRFQRSRPLRFSEITNTYLTINLNNSELATTLSVAYLFFLLNEPKCVKLQRCPKISDEFFAVVQSPHTFEELNLSGLSQLTDHAVTAIEERFVNLTSIHLWPTISEKGLTLLTSFASLTSINLTDCKNVNDNILNLILKPQKNRYLLSLNVSNCTEITDKSIAQLHKSTTANYLQTLVLDHCTQISNNALLKVVKACVSLQNFSIVSHHECRIYDSTVIELANSRGPIIRSLNFARCDKLTADSLIAIGKFCPNITDLNISHCKQVAWSGILEVAKSCTKLTHLDLVNTNVNDEVLVQFCKNSINLKYLSIQRTNISPKLIIPCLKYLQKLETLILKENSLSDNLLLAIANGTVPNLQLLDISSSPTNLSLDTLKFLKARRVNLKLITERI